jgi:hypothetical protein
MSKRSGCEGGGGEEKKEKPVNRELQVVDNAKC